MKKTVLVLTAIGFLVGCGGGGEGITDSDKDTISDTKDNCPRISNTNQLDTDKDGKGNVCDADDDNDGFDDKSDPAPLDDSRPGDFSTPEKILAYPPFKKILEEEVNMPTELAKNPPNITGYYSKASGEGTFLATGNGQSVGNSIVGYEYRFDVYDDHSIDTARVSFSDSKHIGFSLSKGAIIRGEGARFSVYTLGKGTCTEGGSDYSMYYVKISSATLDDTKDIVDRKSLALTVDTEGNLTQVCADRWAGNGEEKDGWTFDVYDIAEHIEDANEMQYMCVDENKAYAPTESWTNSAKQSCTCTKEYTVSCK